MATPSSSNTTPSPSLANALPIPAPHDREQRQRAVGKFIARAEISMVTRVLKARLSYASYKAAHNVPHASLQQLEEQIQAQATLASRAPGGKRRAGGSLYYNSQPDISTTTPYPFVNLVVDPPMEVDPLPRPSSSANLFVTLLTPPVPRPRTVHNANDPLPKAAVRPEPLARPRHRHSSTRSIAEGTRAQAKHRREERAAVTAAAKRKSKQKAVSRPKSTSSDKNKVDKDGDVDMKAAAALTLLYQHRPSPESPRQSIGSSDEAGSEHMVSTDVQTPTPSHQATPPPSSSGAPGQETSPSQPPDKEAADLMLFLATSPSPVRPKTTTDKDAKDLAAFRTLNAGLKDRGRVLFQSEGETDGPRPPISPSRTPRPLSRAESGESSFASVSSIGGDMGGRSPIAAPATLPNSPTPSSAFLQPPAILHSSSSPLSQGGKRATQPATSGSSFNVGEYVHVSPSRPGTKGSLRADIGRKLFEGHRQTDPGQTEEPQELEGRGLDASIDLSHD